MSLFRCEGTGIEEEFDDSWQLVMHQKSKQCNENSESRACKRRLQLKTVNNSVRKLFTIKPREVPLVCESGGPSSPQNFRTSRPTSSTSIWSYEIREASFWRFSKIYKTEALLQFEWLYELSIPYKVWSKSDNYNKRKVYSSQPSLNVLPSQG